MEYVYAAMLLHKAGKDVSEESVKKVITAAGLAVDDAKVKSLLAALEGVNIDDAIKEAAVAAPVAAAAPTGEAKKEEKKEKPKEEKKSAEEAAAGLGALFG